MVSSMQFARIFHSYRKALDEAIFFQFNIDISSYSVFFPALLFAQVLDSVHNHVYNNVDADVTRRKKGMDMLAMGNTLYHARVSKGISQRALAQLAGVSVPVITRMEKGEEITQQSFEKLCKALGVKPEEVDDVPIISYVRLHAHLKRMRANEP